MTDAHSQLAARSLSLAWLLAGSLQAAPGPLERWSLSADVAMEVSGGLVSDQRWMEQLGAGLTTTAVAIPLPEGADLVALDLSQPGQWLFCTDVPVAIPGGSSRPGDVLGWNGVALSRVFDASAAGVPAGVGCDAVTRTPSGLLLSFDGAFDSAPLFGAADLVAWNGSNLSLSLSAAEMGLPAWSNIDALTLAPNGYWLSLDGGGSVSGISYADEDVLAYDTGSGSWSLVRRLAPDSTAFAAADLDALSVQFVADALLVDGFE